MSAVESSLRPAGVRTDPFRVMVVDDSAVIRGMISRWIEAEADMIVAASIRTGLDAVNQVERVDPDVVVLDIEMPDMDGITALPLLLKKKPNLIVIMASTLTRRNAEISFKALALGASDYIPKPESTRELGAADHFKHDLIEKVRHLGARLRRPGHVSSPPIAPVTPRVAMPLALSAPLRAAAAGPVLRPFGKTVRPCLVGSFFGRSWDALLVAGLRRDVFGLRAAEVQQIGDRAAFLGRSIEHGVAQHMRGVGNRMGDDVVLAHLEATALDGRDAHAAALGLDFRATGFAVLGRALITSSHSVTMSASPSRSAFSRSWRTSAMLNASILSLVQAAERPGRTSLIVNIAFPS